MVRTVLTPDKAAVLLAIPPQYIGKKLEVLLYAVEELTETAQPNTMAQFWDTLSDESAQDLRTQIEASRQEWDRI